MWFWNRKNLGQLSSLVIAGWWESWNSLLLCEWWRNLCAFFRTGSASLVVLSVSKAWFLSFYVRYFKQPILPMWWRHNRIDPPHLARQCIIAFVAKKLPIVEIWRRRYRCILLGSSSHEEFMHFFFEYTSEQLCSVALGFGFVGNMEICVCRFSFVIAGFGVFVFGLSFQAQEVLLKVPPWFWKHPCDGNIWQHIFPSESSISKDRESAVASLDRIFHWSPWGTAMDKCYPEDV